MHVTLPRILIDTSMLHAFRLGVILATVLAVLGLPVLPVMHLHQPTSGEALVHAHLSDAHHPGDGQIAIEQDEHEPVRTFCAVLAHDTASPLLAALPVESVVRVPASPLAALSLMPSLALPAIHGPPRTSASLRAPPA